LVITEADLYLYPVVTAAIIFVVVLLDRMRYQELRKLLRRGSRSGRPASWCVILSNESSIGVRVPSCFLSLILAAGGVPAERPSDEASRLLEQANASYAARRPAEAVHLYQDYLARFPDRADVRVYLGAALLNLGKTAEALSEARRALQLDRAYGRAYILEGRIYAARRNWEEAQQAFGEAIRWNPGEREAWYFSGRAYYDENRFDKAAQAFERALKVGDGQSRVYDNLGLCYEQLGRFASAERAYRRAIEVGPGEFQPHLDYGVYLHKQGRTAESLKLLERALSFDPENVDARFELGKALNQTGQNAAAARILEPAAVSNQCRIHYLLLRIYSQLSMSLDVERQAKALETCRNEP
jgi:tetratricopeptide (TPR) repeat protein